VNPSHSDKGVNRRSVSVPSSRQLITAEAEERENERRPRVLLLDLSGNVNASTEWAAAHFEQANITAINKADLKWASKREALARARAFAPKIFSVFTIDLRTQSRLAALMLFAVLAGARKVVIGDGKGNIARRSRLGVLLLEAPRLVLELLVGYLLIIPISWFLTEALGLLLFLRPVVRASRTNKRRRERMSALYIRATLGNAAEGGMPTHVAGFSSACAALGHRLGFIESGSHRRNDVSISIKPSGVFGSTKALFELWNNLAFTARSLTDRGTNREFSYDFIYQRYSRFNWTGVALTMLTGRPLALEFNGSEVWVSRQWDPIGQLWLLKRFERLSLRAADLIFVVSEVERRNLIDAGMTPEKIVVNPNGVDTDRFRPGCGGRELRRALGIDANTVVGFVGTFGPWHGAPVLAEAARLVTSNAHFLFVGDGDQRAQTESIAKTSSVSVTFTGRVSHADVPAYLDACDILVSPHVPATDGSEFFGSPTKLFEYLSMAKPVIASRLGQIADVIRDQENGLLVEPGDASALAHAIEKLAHDESLRAQLGAAGRQTVLEQYTWRRNAARVFDAMRAKAST
jgi:glycosyltransferase involved in cell wall biosynthesis